MPIAFRPSTCGLEPPEPLVRILAVLEAEGSVRFLLSRDPLALYGMLKVEGRRYRDRRRPEGVEITVEGRAADVNQPK